jgi:hypothetical protein
MFERNRVDNALQTTSVPAEITLEDGLVTKGRFVINASRSIFDVLNGEGRFIEFETYEGEKSLLAKARLASVKIVSVPGANNLRARAREADAFDPHSILGVASGAPWDDVRRAYVALSKTYHPDRFAGMDLPAEVLDYLAVMARRVNAAYTALEVPHLAQKRAVVERAKPIFTSPQRFGAAPSRPVTP